MSDKIRLGISACLLGQNVRYDGGHKLERFLRDTLGRFVELTPVCPEAECGLGVPREPMRLVGDPERPRLVTTRTKVDHTARMRRWAATRCRELEKQDLCGFIFKSRSPSCGVQQVRIHTGAGTPSRRGTGLFASAFMDRFPMLPAEDDGRLHDVRLRENFIERIFVFRRWRDAVAAARRGALVAFHTRHKLLLMSHSEKHTRALGKLVARIKDVPRAEFRDRYLAAMTEAMRLLATPAKHANVLQHVMGYVRRQVSADEKQELLGVIRAYRAGHVPLIVPITLLNHYVQKYEQPYLSEQWYLAPHPLELQLRNHA